MYSQNAAMIALATAGIQRGTDRDIRDISGEIRTNRTSENVKLNTWYGQLGFGSIPVDFGRAQTVVDSLSAPLGGCFDVEYAKQMIGLLRQSVEANELAMSRASLCQLRDQAKVAARHERDEIRRLERWLCAKGVTVE